MIGKLQLDFRDVFIAEVLAGDVAKRPLRAKFCLSSATPIGLLALANMLFEHGCVPFDPYTPCYDYKAKWTPHVSSFSDALASVTVRNTSFTRGEDNVFRSPSCPAWLEIVVPVENTALPYGVIDVYVVSRSLACRFAWMCSVAHMSN